MSTTTLSEFHTLVSDALGKGTSLDTLIAKRTEWSARWLERNYVFQYMRSWQVLTVDNDADFPYIVSLSGLNLRKLETIRRRTTDTDGSYLFGRPLRYVKPADRESRPFGVPESYWLNGVTSIILNSVPDEDMTFEAHIQSFTSWGTAAGWTHWLLDNATNLLLTRTLMMMTSRSRDPKMWETYKGEFDLEIQSFNVAEEDVQTGDSIQVWEPPEFATIDESLRSA